MQENPELQLLTKDESSETPNWVADAGSQGWLAQSRNSFVRAANFTEESSGASQTAELRSVRLFPENSGQTTPDFREHRFYRENAPTTVPSDRLNVYEGGKPYAPPQNNETKPQFPVGIPFPEEMPLDRQIIPEQTLPWPKLEMKTNPGLPEERNGAVFVDANRILIPSFELQDPVLDGNNKPKVLMYSVTSPEARLYLQNRDSIVKINTDKSDSDGKEIKGVASGFFVTENGQIATANHVINGATRITVTTASGKIYNARVVESHPGSEAATIELVDVAAGEKFRPIPLRDSSVDLSRGEKLTVLGHPNGVKEIVMSNGVFLSRERFAGTSFSYPGVNPNSMFLHASARIQGGNSGGPVLDSQGRAVGLTNFRHGDNSGEFVGIDDVRSLISDGKGGKLSDQRSYFIPSSLQLDKDVRSKGFDAFVTTTNLVNSYVGRHVGKHPVGYANLGARMMGSGLAVGFSISQMPEDYKAFKSALENGTNAERINAGIDLGSDVLTAAGSLTAVVSRRYAFLGSTVAAIGSYSRLGNAILGDRRYH